MKKENIKIGLTKNFVDNGAEKLPVTDPLEHSDLGKPIAVRYTTVKPYSPSINLKGHTATTEHGRDSDKPAIKKRRKEEK